LVEAKKPRTANFEEWRLSVSCSFTAATGAILQWREEIASCWWDSDGGWKIEYFNSWRKERTEVL
jgi:hypothetical protein